MKNYIKEIIVLVGREFKVLNFLMHTLYSGYCKDFDNI